MAQYNFKGNVDGISEVQLEFIRKVIEELGYNDSNVTFETVGEDGDNYSANVKRIVIDGENGTLKIIAKIAPTHEILRFTTNAAITFKNEHLMYTEVLPKFLQLQKDAEIPEDEQLKYAKCYGTFIEEPNEVILLEDLTTLGYNMLDRFVSLNNDCVRSVLKNFASYHSLSYVLKNKEPETYDHFKDSLIDMWSKVAEMEEQFPYFKQLEENTVLVLENPEHKNIVKGKVIGIREIGERLAKTEKNNKFAVIQQGDSWTNNVMFMFEEDILKRSIMIDYQISKHGNAVYDILYFIFNCTDHELRSKHFYEWIDYYHSELEKSLSNFGMKANFVYPRDQLDADLKRYSKLLFGLSIILSSVLSLKSEDALKMKEAMKSADVNDITENMGLDALNQESVLRFRTKLIDLIDSYKQFGLL